MFFGSKKRPNNRGNNPQVQHTHHNHNTHTQKVKVVEKKVYVKQKQKGGANVGKVFGATVSTGAKVGGSIVGFAKKGYEMSQKKQHDPMSRDSSYGSKAKYKERKDPLQKQMLGFPNNATMSKMKRTGFSFLFMLLVFSSFVSPMVLADGPEFSDIPDNACQNADEEITCGYEEGDGEDAMLFCFAMIIYTVSIGMLQCHFWAIVWILLGVVVILIFLAFAAIVGGAVSRSINR